MRTTPTVIMPNIDTTSNCVCTNVTNQSLNGWSVGNWIQAFNEMLYQINLKNSDTSKYEKAIYFNSRRFPIALSADL